MSAGIHLLVMARNLRFAPPGYWLHITQRGNYRREIFRHDGDRHKYLELMGLYAEERQIQIMGYSLMPNHVHLIALGKYQGAVSQWMRCLNGHYGQRMHFLEERRGRFWQDRFFSCTLDERHLRAALRYTELNPVRAGLVKDATHYPWSSAAAHTGLGPHPAFLNHDEFALRHTPNVWRLALTSPQPQSELAVLRLATRLGQPLGSPEFLSRLETEFDVVLPRAIVPAITIATGA